MQKSAKCKEIRLISFVNGFLFNIFDISEGTCINPYPEERILILIRKNL
jgi:hypothetical protein